MRLPAPRRLTTALTCALALLPTLGLGGCSAHDPFCETTVTCVVACGDDAPFLQCFDCPDGSVPAETCGDAATRDATPDGGAEDGGTEDGGTIDAGR